MQMVIEISEETYNDIQSRDWKNGELVFSEEWKAIHNGIPIPEGHGDLIDRNDLLKHYDNTTYYNGIEERKIHFVQIGYVNDAPTIIPADKEGSNANND